MFYFAYWWSGETIDDVNMVGFVDILRYEFGDRQIFISTHEQSFEWFLRYRYSKAEKKVNVLIWRTLCCRKNSINALLYKQFFILITHLNDILINSREIEILTAI